MTNPSSKEVGPALEPCWCRSGNSAFRHIDNILKTARRQDGILKDWANRVRHAADKLSTTSLRKIREI